MLRLFVLRPAAAHRWIAATLVMAAALASDAPTAAEPRAPVSDAEVSGRLSFIEARIERATPSACLWRTAWYYGYMVVTVGQASVALGTTNRGLRIDSGVGAAFASLGVLGLGVVDFPPLHAAATLRALPARTPAERRRKLARAEGLLAEGARSEVAGRSWVAHVAGSAVTLTSSLVLAFAYKRIASSIITLVSGVGITEAQIFTRPTGAIDDWRAYQQGAWAGTTQAAGQRMTWSVVAHPGGVGLATAF